MKNIITSLFLIFSLYGLGQDFAYLEDTRLRKKTDFIENESTVIKANDFLMSNPINEDLFNRKACTRFIIKYAEKSPFITMTLDGSLLKVCEGNNGLLQMYMGLWIKSAINNKNKSDDFHEFYIYNQLYVYCSQGNGVVKTEVINSLIKAGDDDNISNWLSELKN